MGSGRVLAVVVSGEEKACVVVVAVARTHAAAKIVDTEQEHDTMLETEFKGERIVSFDGTLMVDSQVRARLQRVVRR